MQDRDRVIDSLRVRLERMDQLLREAKTQSQVQRIQNLTLPSDQNLSEQSRTELSEQRITVDRTMKRLETLQTLSKNLLLDDE